VHPRVPWTLLHAADWCLSAIANTETGQARLARLTGKVHGDAILVVRDPAHAHRVEVILLDGGEGHDLQRVGVVLVGAAVDAVEVHKVLGVGVLPQGVDEPAIAPDR